MGQGDESGSLRPRVSLARCRSGASCAYEKLTVGAGLKPAPTVVYVPLPSFLGSGVTTQVARQYLGDSTPILTFPHRRGKELRAEDTRLPQGSRSPLRVNARGTSPPPFMGEDEGGGRPPTLSPLRVIHLAAAPAVTQRPRALTEPGSWSWETIPRRNVRAGLKPAPTVVYAMRPR